MSKRGRWHRTRAGSTDPFRCVLSLCISNEALWNQGLYYKGIHIGTKDDEITSEYDWWSYGFPEFESARWINKGSTPRHTATSETHISIASALLRATVRSVEEPVRPILAEDLRRGDPEAILRYKEYLRTALRRGVNKYGRTSVQHRVLQSSLSSLRKDETTAIMREQWAPSWRTLMQLDQDKQELGPVQPRPLPSTLRRRRLLHPRPSPASTSSVSTDRLLESQGHRTRSILSPDIAPVAEAGGSSGVGNPDPLLKSTPRASQRKTAKNRIRGVLSSAHHASGNMTAKPETEKKSRRLVSTPRACQQDGYKYGIRRILSPVDYASHNTTEKSETGEDSARRVSTTRTTSRPRNPCYVPKGLPSRLSATRPEAEVDTSAMEAAGRDWVNFRRSFRSRQQKEMKKSHKTKTGRELHVTDGSNAPSF